MKSSEFTTRVESEVQLNDMKVAGGRRGLTALSPSCIDVNLKSGFFFLSRSLHAVFLNCPSDWKKI